MTATGLSLYASKGLRVGGESLNQNLPNYLPQSSWFVVVVRFEDLFANAMIPKLTLNLGC